MKTIILEEILKSYLTTEVMNANKPDYTFNMVLSAMKEACKQTLELASKNAKIEKVQIDYKKFVNVVSKQSILNTIKQVE